MIQNSYSLDSNSQGGGGDMVHWPGTVPPNVYAGAPASGPLKGRPGHDEAVMAAPSLVDWCPPSPCLVAEPCSPALSPRFLHPLKSCSPGFRCPAGCLGDMLAACGLKSPVVAEGKEASFLPPLQGEAFPTCWPEAVTPRPGGSQAQ